MTLFSWHCCSCPCSSPSASIQPKSAHILCVLPLLRLRCATWRDTTRTISVAAVSIGWLGSRVWNGGTSRTMAHLGEWGHLPFCSLGPTVCVDLLKQQDDCAVAKVQSLTCVPPFVCSCAFFRERQLAWLDAELEESDRRGERVCVLTHVPLAPLSATLSCLSWDYTRERFHHCALSPL